MKQSGHGLLLATIAISMFLDGLDGTIVNVALPDIAESFGIGTGDTSWVVTVYFLVMAGLILVFGRICDMGALKKVLVSGMAIFTFGSLMCGLSSAFPMLLAFRAVQGVGAAMLASSAVMLGVKYLPKEKIGVAMALVVLGTSLGVAVGPTLGAVLTELISWHWIFFINVPIGIIAILLAHRAVQPDEGLEEGDLDLPGSAMLFAAIVLGLFAIERMPSEGLNAAGIASIVGCIVLMAVFLHYEKGKASPVLKTSLFRNRGFDTAILAYIAVNMCLMGMVYLMPFFLRKVAGLETLESGLLLSMQAVSMIICCLLVGRKSDILGDRPFAIISCIILLAFTLVAMTWGPESSLLLIGISLFVGGCVWGVGGGPMGARIVNTLPDEDRGSGSSMISFIMYFSSALGTALIAGLFGFGSGAGSGSISDVPVGTFMDGFTFCMGVCIVLALIALASSWVLRSDCRGSDEESA